MLKVGVIQFSSQLGAFQKNAERILILAKELAAQGAAVIATPELALFGYPAYDLLEYDDVVESQLASLNWLVEHWDSPIQLIVGAVTRSGPHVRKKYHNSAVVLAKKAIKERFHKTLLPSYDVFEETRHFQPGTLDQNYIEVNGYQVLVSICEDIWGWEKPFENPVADLSPQNTDFVINLSASPFAIGQSERRLSVIDKTSHYLQAPVVYVNLVGGQDELVFDGGSLLYSKGNIIEQAVLFHEEARLFHYSSQSQVNSTNLQSKEALLSGALILGLRDFVTKCGFQKVHLGLSGGIDSALVLCLAVKALGAENVKAFALPGPFSDPRSLDSAKELAGNLGAFFQAIDIVPGYELLISTFENSFGVSEFGLMHENLQARLRGLALMAYSNTQHSMLLATGNKSEFAMGYSTLYGDMCGGLAPIGDLTKQEVYALSRTFTEMPAFILERPPSAELRANQKDSDSLPPYEQLDAAVEKIVRDSKSPVSDVELRVRKQVLSTEFKRWQAPPILRVSSHAFGRGRRFPVAVRGLLNQ